MAAATEACKQFYKAVTSNSSLKRTDGIGSRQMVLAGALF
jgi:hypothetical protein